MCAPINIEPSAAGEKFALSLAWWSPPRKYFLPPKCRYGSASFPPPPTCATSSRRRTIGPFAFHVHNDIGMGTASLYAALEGGAEILDVSVNGLGERAGIAPLAEVAAVVQLWYGLDAGIKLEKMKDLSELVADITKWPVHPKKPCVGDQAHSDLVEVHYNHPPDGFWAYRQWKPEIFGNRTRTMLGHYSGPWALRSMAKELGVTIPDEKLQAVLERVRSEIRLRKRKLQDEEFRKIVQEVG